jgi:hypothetical protein
MPGGELANELPIKSELPVTDCTCGSDQDLPLRPNKSATKAPLGEETWQGSRMTLGLAVD